VFEANPARLPTRSCGARFSRCFCGLEYGCLHDVPMRDSELQDAAQVASPAFYGDLTQDGGFYIEV
jgi:hypothetical protein